jgi:hypothetical protein
MKTVLTFAFLFLAACASSPIKLSEAKSVSPDRVLLVPAQTSKSGKIIIVRDSGGAGNLSDVIIKVDGKEAASIKTGEKIEFSLPEGSHVLGVRFSTNDRVSETTANIVADKTDVFRISAGDMYSPFPLIQATAEVID